MVWCLEFRSVLCRSAATTQISGQPAAVTVTNHTVPDSADVTFNTAGTYYFQAVYSGDANNNGNSSACTSETIIIDKHAPGLSTAQSILPNDAGTLSGATAGPGGTMTCAGVTPTEASCSGTPAWT